MGFNLGCKLASIHHILLFTVEDLFHVETKTAVLEGFLKQCEMSIACIFRFKTGKQ